MLSIIYHINTLRYAVPTAIMMGCAPPFWAAAADWHVLSCLLPERWYRAVDDKIWGTYQRLIEFFFEHYTGVEVILYGDVEHLAKGESVIYMSNHQSTTDWVVADMLAMRAGCVGNMRYILKDGLKYMPLYGSYFGFHGSVFVKRNKQFDEKNQKKFMDRLARLKKNRIPTWMVVFPEGTRFDPRRTEMIKVSQGYAYSQALNVLHQVLSPRVKAFHMCLVGLEGHIDAVYDVTIAYSNTGEGTGGDTINRTPTPSLTEFLTGICPQVHIHLRRIQLVCIPKDPIECHAWLHDRFEEKDRMLQDFYSNDPTKQGRLLGDGHRSRLPLYSTVPALLLSLTLVAPMLLTKTGRNCYWKVWVFGSLAGAMWMKLTT